MRKIPTAVNTSLEDSVRTSCYCLLVFLSFLRHSRGDVRRQRNIRSQNPPMQVPYPATTSKRYVGLSIRTGFQLSPDVRGVPPVASSPHYMSHFLVRGSIENGDVSSESSIVYFTRKIYKHNIISYIYLLFFFL